MEHLIELVKRDLHVFLSSNPTFFYNECDLQMHIAAHLSNSNNYDKIHLEYFVPKNIIHNEITQSLVTPSLSYNPQNLYIDIVVEKNGEFLPIELKYKTAPLKQNITRFGETLDRIDILKNHGARDLGAYDFWRDVSRIECLIKRFKNVKNGIVLFVTNDKGYWELPQDGSTPNYANFSMRPGKHGVNKTWQGNTAMSSSRPSFTVAREYKIKWNTYSTPFQYCLLEI